MKTFIIPKDKNGGMPSGMFGDCFEMTCKFCLSRNNADYVSASGRADFKRRFNYDTKQNASPILYGDIGKGKSAYIYGSSRVIYATHVAYQVVAETAENFEVFIDLANTDMWVVDKKQFVDFLLSAKGMVKDNPTRNQLNIQTIWNYKKNAYHGAKYKVLETWLDENQLPDDSIVEDILEGFYAKCL